MRVRQMIFIDGTNFLVQLSKEFRIEFRAEKPPFMALQVAVAVLQRFNQNPQSDVIRRFWFASYRGTEEYQLTYRQELRQRGFDPRLYRKRDGREKGVDIALTKEMLVNAFQQNCDEVILLAGDEDYVELVEEVKRYGQKVYGLFFQAGLSENLRLALDRFEYIDQVGYGSSIESMKRVIEQQAGVPRAP